MGFYQQVYQAVQQIPAGRVATYGDVAKILGTRDARRVGHALHANSDPKIPCHRVVFANGSLAPGYAFGGPLAQRKRLESEGVNFFPSGKVDMKKHREY